MAERREGKITKEASDFRGDRSFQKGQGRDQQPVDRKEQGKKEGRKEEK